MKWGAAAVSVAVIACAAMIFVQYNEPALPMLSISENTTEGMGYEAYMAYDISELVDANPWTEASEISELPVYKNVLHEDENHVVIGAALGKMQAFLLDVAERLGLDPDTLTITDNAPSEEEKQQS